MNTDYDVAAPPLGAHCTSWGEETRSGSGTSSTGTIRLSTMLFVPMLFSEADTPVSRAQHRDQRRASACKAGGRAGVSGGRARGWLRTRPAAVHVAHSLPTTERYSRVRFKIRSTRLETVVKCNHKRTS